MVNLEGAELELSSDGTLLIVSAGRWGKDGKNWGNCTFNAVKQKLEGTITVDPISSLSLNLTDGSSFTGVIAGDGQVALTLDQTSTWTLTGDSSISSFTGDPSCIITNGYTLYVNGSTLTGTW